MVEVAVEVDVGVSPAGDMARGGGRGLGDQPKVMKHSYTVFLAQGGMKRHKVGIKVRKDLGSYCTSIIAVDPWKLGAKV